MATIKKVIEVPDKSTAAPKQRNNKATRAASRTQQAAMWEKGGNAGTIHFPEGTTGPAPASRTAPIPAAAPEHLGPQFGGNAPMAGLHANLSKAGYASGPSMGPQSPMSAYRSSLRQVALGSSGSSNHSLGAALNEDPTMYGGIHQAVISAASTGLMSRLRNRLGGGGGSSSSSSASGKGGKNKAAGLKSPHEGMLARHLKNATGVRG
jgi:hypothetical protein